jgi:uncharacterized protein (DUF427 family)
MPGHIVGTVRGSQVVTVEIDGEVVARSARPVLLSETGMPVRYYLPPEDVDLDRFEATGTRTVCPFKGEASYWTFLGAAGGQERVDVAWAYPTPIDAVAEIAGHLCFYDTVAHITVRDEPPTG